MLPPIQKIKKLFPIYFFLVVKGGVKSRFTLEDLELMRKLSGEANNLNQIARQANKSGFSVSAMEVIKISKQIKDLFNDR